MVRFLHTADWQLGMTRRFLQGEAQARFTQDRIDAIRRLGDLARREECAFVVVSGDVFEHSQVEPRTVKRALEAMATIGLPVFLLPGNHDPLDAASVYGAPTFTAACPANVRVLSESGVVALGDGVELLAVPWTSKRPGRDLVAAALATATPPTGVRIGIAHGRVDRGAFDPDEAELIGLDAVEAALADGRLHFLALGDRHSVTEVTPRVWYSGTPEVTDFTETHAGHALVVDVDARTCTVNEHRIGRWQFVERELTITAAEDLERLRDLVHSATDKERTVLRLALHGTVSVAQRAQLETLLEDVLHRFAALEDSPRTSLLTLPADQDFADVPLEGFARTALDELRAAATGDPQAADALGLLYRLCLTRGEA